MVGNFGSTENLRRPKNLCDCVVQTVLSKPLSGPHNHQLENSSQKFDFSVNGQQVGGGACPLWKNARGVTPPRLSGSRVPGYTERWYRINMLTSEKGNSIGSYLCS